MIHYVEAKTCPEAWLNAADYLLQQEDYSTYSMILDVESPVVMTPADFRIFDQVDHFLRNHKRYPLVTVAGTIFPGGLYRKYGSSGVYEVYPKEVYPKAKEQWGTYAFRIVRRYGPDSAEMNPLQILVEKLQRQLETAHPLRAAYELNTVDCFADLPLYDAASDSTRTRSQPCLSHLSFRIISGNSLMLTAFYRSHYYVQKTLGNLLGIAQLQGFVAHETGLNIGPLVCHSTYATLERHSGEWGKSDIERLIQNCHKAADSKAA
jgi:hypothetical protein